MRERHNWATGKHPKTCTCATCEKRRAEAAMPKVKKKRKPKSQRGKRGAKVKDAAASSALEEVMDIFGFSDSEKTDSDNPDSETGKREPGD